MGARFRISMLACKGQTRLLPCLGIKNCSAPGHSSRLPSAFLRSIYIYIYIYMYHIHTYIHMSLSLSTYIHMYIYIYIYKLSLC